MIFEVYIEAHIRYFSHMSLLPAPADQPFILKVRDVEERFSQTRVNHGPDIAIGKFSFELAVTAAEDIYVPLSISSGKKPTGFVYQIEGTAEGKIITAHISCKGEGITQIMLGTLVYCKIPAGMTALIRMRIEIRGQLGKEYRILIYQMNYKKTPTDARYIKSVQDIHSKMLRFSR